MSELVVGSLRTKNFIEIHNETKLTKIPYSFFFLSPKLKENHFFFLHSFSVNQIGIFSELL